MRIAAMTLFACCGLVLSAGNVEAHDNDLHRWLGIGWGPGYHAYNGPAGHGGCPPSWGNGWSGMQSYSPASHVNDFRPPARGPEPLPAARPQNAPASPQTAPAPSMQIRTPLHNPTLAPPLVKPSEEAARSGRYFPPSPQYSPTYVGQRYPRLQY